MLRNFNWRDPQFTVRASLGVLLAANLVAAGMLLYPPGGSADDLQRELAALQTQVVAKRALIEKVRQHAAAVEMGRAEGDQFLSDYFLPRRSAPEMLLSELDTAAKGSVRERERSVSLEPVEGSDSLFMMTITANYEGTYADLLHFVHEIDKAKRLLIIESLNAAPQAGSKTLSVSMKLETFVREDAGAAVAMQAAAEGASQ